MSSETAPSLTIRQLAPAGIDLESLTTSHSRPLPALHPHNYERPTGHDDEGSPGAKLIKGLRFTHHIESDPAHESRSPTIIERSEDHHIAGASGATVHERLTAGHPGPIQGSHPPHMVERSLLELLAAGHDAEPLMEAKLTELLKYKQAPQPIHHRPGFLGPRHIHGRSEADSSDADNVATIGVAIAVFSLVTMLMIIVACFNRRSRRARDLARIQDTELAPIK